MSDGTALSSVITFLPLAGAAFILLIRGDAEEVVARNARYRGALDLADHLRAVAVHLVRLRARHRRFPVRREARWLPEFGINYHMGVDGISVLFVLTTLLTAALRDRQWDAIKTRVKEFMIAFLVLETLMIGMFCALDFVLFYIFFEGVLIPMFLIIGVWGGPAGLFGLQVLPLHPDSARC